MTPKDFFTDPPEQGPVGRSPQRYLDELPEVYRPNDAERRRIPHKGTKPLTRDQVRELCRDINLPSLTVYACIMAWGGRDFGNYRRSLEDGGDAIIKLVKTFRKSTSTRQDDFQMIQTAARSIPGLGISFYTKLLFFLREKPDAYILDQWTAKSATLLFPALTICLTAAGLPDPETTGQTYDAFCSRLEACCGSDGWGVAWRTGEEVERTIFDSPKGPWRQWLKAFLSEDTSTYRRTKKPRAAKNGEHGKSCTIRSFAKTLKETYLKSINFGFSLPDGCGGFAAPNRLHIRRQDGFLFQFIINKNEVRAQLFLSGRGVKAYSELVTALMPTVVKVVHDFGGDIVGNGPNKGKTRAIDLAASFHGGWGSREENWAVICESAVEAMATLFHFLETHLPAT